MGSDDKFKAILPICPTLHKLYKARPTRQSKIDQFLFQSIRAGDCASIERTMRLWSFKMLKKIGYEVLQSIYLSLKTHFAVIRASGWRSSCHWSKIEYSICIMCFESSVKFAASFTSSLLNNFRVKYESYVWNWTQKSAQSSLTFLHHSVTELLTYYRNQVASISAKNPTWWSSTISSSRWTASFTKSNDIVFYVNGTLVGTDTNATIPACSQFSLNNYSKEAAPKYNQALLYNTRLSNSELAALTSL